MLQSWRSVLPPQRQAHREAMCGKCSPLPYGKASLTWQAQKVIGSGISVHKAFMDPMGVLTNTFGGELRVSIHARRAYGDVAPKNRLTTVAVYYITLFVLRRRRSSITSCSSARRIVIFSLQTATTPRLTRKIWAFFVLQSHLERRSRR